MRQTNHICRVRRMAALMLCLALVFLAGCGGKDEEQPAAVHTDAVFRLAVTEAPDSLNPFVAQGQTAEEFFLLAYDSLWRTDAAGEAVNCLVEDWSLSSDQLTWTIRLRRDVTFSDGKPVTAEDVKFSYENLRQNSLYTHCFDGITGIRCPDNYTVVISTSYVKGDMQHISVPILPKHVWSAYSGRLRDFDNEQMIGSGPFIRRLVDAGPQEQSWVFRAREDYFAGPAVIGEVQFVYYATAASAGRAISTGDVDGAVGMTDVQLTTMEAVPGVRLIQAFLPGSQVWAVAFNARSGVFQEAAMRQMVEYCTDRSRIVSMSAGDAGMTGTVWASPGVDYFYNVPTPRTLNQEAARAVLYSLGYSDVDMDGNMEFIGNREDLVVRLYTSSQDDWSATAATILTEDMEKLGIQVQRHSIDGPIASVCTPKGSWDMCMVSWRGNANAVLGAQPFYGSGDSLTGWSSDMYMQVYGQLQVATDRETIRNLAGQLQQIVYDECPYLILGYHSDIQAVREDRWTGYDEILSAAGGLFGIGCADTYMTIAPAEAAG